MTRTVLVSPIMPAASGNGLAMRMGVFAEALARIGPLQVVVVPAAGGPTHASPLLRQLGAEVHVVPLGRPDPRFALLARIADPGLRLAAFRAFGRPSMSGCLSGTVLQEVADRIREAGAGLVHVGRSYLTPILDRLPDRLPLTLDLDESDLHALSGQARIARSQRAGIRAAWLDQEAAACDSLVARHGPRFRRIFASSQREATLLRRSHRSLEFSVAANAVGLPATGAPREDTRCLLFVGTLGFAPNADGIVEFARTVFPALRGSRAGRGCRLLIAGANPPPAVQALGRDPAIAVLGFVPDLTALYRQASLTLAPLAAGGGTRIKLLESAAHGVASVATPTGALGLDWPAGTGGWIAGTRQSFRHACAEALADPAERARRAARGAAFVRRHHSRAKIAADVARSIVAAL